MEIDVINTTIDDLETIIWLFERAIGLQVQNSYKVWEHIDIVALRWEIMQGQQYKVVYEKTILCIFSIRYSDPFIWGSRDQNDAVYLHRIVTNPDFKGKRFFQKALNWIRQLALNSGLKFVRLEVRADNVKLIDYYRSLGFALFSTYITKNMQEIQIQKQNLKIALLELEL